MAKSPDRPMNSIDIDVGGTFTDLVLTLDGERTIAKCPTTPHDLSICFMNAVEEGAQICGLAMSELMPRIDIVRYSTTVALNEFIQRQGPRVGLMMTEGHEDAILIGRGAQWVDGKRVTERRNLAVQRKPLPLIERRMIVGIRERIEFGGFDHPPARRGRCSVEAQTPDRPRCPGDRRLATVVIHETRP